MPLVAHRWNCHTSKFDSCLPTVLEKSVFLRISQCSICFPWATDTICTLLFSNNYSFHAWKSGSGPVDHCGDNGVFRPTSGWRRRRRRRRRRKISIEPEYSLASLGIMRGLITEKISYEISKSWDFAKDFRISGKISRFHLRFQDFT